VVLGTGAEATPGSVVGAVRWQTIELHRVRYTFTLGQQGLIAGFQIAVNGMKEGGERLLEIPAELGCGVEEVKDKNGKVIVPANSMLLFEVT
jgi:FKBP-type peptidyl-prolyl cis-trans isomerase